MKNGFSVIWKVGKKEHSEEFLTMREAQNKVNELKSKGYKGIKVIQCIF